MDEALPQGDDPIRWLDWTSAQQARASDPKSSAWVSANAGSGKTHVLSQRVIRLLLSGCRPSAILCLTYTKAAAAEMANRVFQRLAEWTLLDDAALGERIAAMEGAEPDALRLAEARRLFARALETPGGLKIQTIHAFCEALLHQFPLEANVAGHFSVLDERAGSALLAEARRSLMGAISAEEDGELAKAFDRVLEAGDEYGLEKLFAEIVANRSAIRRFLSQAQAQGGAETLLRRAFGLDADDSEAGILAGYFPMPGLDGDALADYIALAGQGGVRVAAAADGLQQARREGDPAKRAAILDGVFLRASDLQPKAEVSLLSAAMKKRAPHLIAAVMAAQTHVVASRNRLKAMKLVETSGAALALAARLDADYEDLKKQRGLLDFEDLIERTAALLERADVGAWVHYKLDQGIDHILVDEAQDTSPVQWAVIRALAEDFFAGEGARRARRTLFAVGDEKQSIYSFQGARPERFDAEGRETARRAMDAAAQFHPVRLPLSFRSTPDVLAAVDQVFSLPENAAGLSAAGEPVIHRSNRSGEPGAVEFWEEIAPAETEEDGDWTAPFDALPDQAPAARLASRIAARIEAMIGSETIVHKGEHRAITPGDILVLVRKRDGFINALTRALKRRNNIAVAGADRLRLTDHIAVQDLMALGRFLLLPQDDLSLAALLKSPLFNHSEDEILTLAAGRDERQSLWARLEGFDEAQAPRLAASADRLRQLQALSRRLGPHDFYARLLGPLGGRRAFLGRLGSEASDILDEFLTFALEHETAGLPGLQALISTLEMQSPEVKREQDGSRNEVRIMTVHASKGLEAAVVFLVDSGGAAFIAQHLPSFRLLETTDGALPVWLGGGAGKGVAAVEADHERRREAAEAEYRRLLYVAMTRAADRLIVCGYRGKRENRQNWQAMVQRALVLDEYHCQAAAFSGPEGEWPGLRFQLSASERGPERGSGQSGAQSGAAPEKADKPDPAALPPALFTPLPTVSLPRPLSPSGAGAVIEDEDGGGLFVSPLFGESGKGGLALARGRLTHRLLQVLADFPPEARADAAWRYLARAAGQWPAAERTRLAASVLDILAHPQLAEAFGAASRAEVSIMGQITLDGRPWAISGRVDRLAVGEERVTIVDYKTNRDVPSSPEAVPLPHRAQLAIYRELLAPLYPRHAVRCVLVYTQNASVITLPDTVLTRSLGEIKAK